MKLGGHGQVVHIPVIIVIFLDPRSVTCAGSRFCHQLVHLLYGHMWFCPTVTFTGGLCLPPTTAFTLLSHMVVPLLCALCGGGR